MPRFKFCPLGFDNSLCYLPDDYCKNYQFCRLQTYSWELPYEFDVDGFLIVRSYGYALSLIPGGYQRHTIDNNLISHAWRDFGWAAAQSLDPIPF